MKSRWLLFTMPVLLLVLARPLLAAGQDWALYGGEDGRRFSSLTQITRANVASLEQAWRFDMAEVGDPQTHPLAIGGVVYAYTPSLDTIALDGANGKLKWRFHSGVKAGGPQRGLAYWSGGKERRLFANAGSYLYALDPATGKPITGANVRLEGNMSHAGMAAVFAETTEVEPGLYRTNMEFTMAGDWLLSVHVTLSDGTHVDRQFDIKGVAPA